ncbi:MAG: FG-GAP-like repeat-containing protein [bacterium]
MKVLNLLMLMMLSILLNAQVPLETNASWTSCLNTPGPGDIEFADIDNDGYLDMVTGNEFAPDSYSTCIYFNTGTGYDVNPSLILPDTNSCTVALGDLDNDGDMDLASAYVGYIGSRIKLYLNEGGFDRIPDWIGSTGAVWLGWGDVDNDGDLDLGAVEFFGPACVYLNNNGVLEPTPSWQASDYFGPHLAGTWFDVDNDGDLDLAIGFNYRIYFNDNGILETVASWYPDTQLTYSGAGFSAGDINKDGLLDLVVGVGATYPASNVIHFNTPSGLETTPSWISDDSSRTCRVALGDVNNDGYLDLAAVNGNMPSVVYHNNAGNLETNPGWQANSPIGNVWGIAWGDVDGDGVLSRTDTLTGDGFRKLFYVSHQPIHKFLDVIVDGFPLPFSDYCYNLTNGWMSLKDAPGNGSQVLIDYIYSADLDLAVGVDSQPPAIHRNLMTGIEEEKPCASHDKSFMNNNPNPFRNSTEISVFLVQPDVISLDIYDAVGKKVLQIFIGLKETGRHTFHWDGKDDRRKQCASGIYFAELQTKECGTSCKPIILTK